MYIGIRALAVNIVIPFNESHNQFHIQKIFKESELLFVIELLAHTTNVPYHREVLVCADHSSSVSSML